MATQIGIELSPAACRIVEVDRPRGRSPLLTRALTVSPDATSIAEALAEYRGRAASVVVWGAPGDHRQVMVTRDCYATMRAEAIGALALAGVETRDSLVDISRAPECPQSTRTRRAVVVALASARAVRAALRPVHASHVRVKTVATPATALVSLARLRRQVQTQAPCPALEAYVVLDATSTGIAVFRDGALAAACETASGFVDRAGNAIGRHAVALELGRALDAFLGAIGGTVGELQQITLCGGFAELRTVAAALTQRFDVEVEPLDNALETDASGAPSSAALRLAWAVAADVTAPLSLFHARQVRATQARFARVAVAAGIVVGVGLGLKLARSPLIDVASRTFVAEPGTGVQEAAGPDIEALSGQGLASDFDDSPEHADLHAARSN